MQETGWLQEVLDDVRREVKDWPAWMRPQEVSTETKAQMPKDDRAAPKDDGPFGGPGCAPPPDRNHDICYLLGRCANGAERDGGRLHHAVRGYQALCGTTFGRQSAGWSSHQVDRHVTCSRCLKKLRNENHLTCGIDNPAVRP